MSSQTEGQTSPELFARLKEILLTFPKLPEVDRPAYLANACGDDADLRRHVESILSPDVDLPDILKTGGIGELIKSQLGANIDESKSGSLPDRIGPYTILGVLGEGGMGIVYRALQTEPIRREVALKLIKRGMDTDQVVTRFEGERQALALMDHPHIATVLDAGADDSGRPYFVMELVRGVSITEYCTQNDIGIRKRLEIVLSICRAIQHAHQKGVIHRDLKPSNILVAVQDGVPVPRIIDFGIAKAVSAPEDGRTLLTRQGELIGTPEYMSPEQARGDTKGIDPRTDVYSLGVVLYQLLTGNLPYETKGASVTDVALAICEESPRRIERKGTGTGRIDRDIETIVIKALEKEVDRRYHSAAALGDDIERYVASQPISARPPSTTYQLRKLVARHRVLVAFLSTIVVFLLAFGVTMAFMFESQRRAHARAEEEARRAEQTSDFVREMLRSVKPDEQGRDVTVREVLDQSAKDIESGLDGQPEVRANVQQTIGETYLALGLLNEAEPHLRAAVDAQQEIHGANHPDLIIALESLGGFLLERGAYAEAESVTHRTLALRRARLSEDDPALAEDLNTLARLARHQGRPTEAESLYRKALAIRIAALGDTAQEVGSSKNDLAVALWNWGRFAEAEPLYRAAIEIRRAGFGDDHPDVVTMNGSLAVLMTAMGRCVESESLTHAVLESRYRILGEEHWYIGIDRCNLGESLECQGRYLEAEEQYRESLRVLRNAYGEEHLRIGIVLRSLAKVLQTQGKHFEAEEAWHQTIDMFEKCLGRDHVRPASNRISLASLWLDMDRAGEAESVIRENLEIIKALKGEDHHLVGRAENILGRCLALLGHTEEAESLLVRSLPKLRRGPQGWYDRSLQRTAELYESWGRPDEAEEYRMLLRPSWR